VNGINIVADSSGGTWQVRVAAHAIATELIVELEKVG